MNKLLTHSFAFIASMVLFLPLSQAQGILLQSNPISFLGPVFGLLIIGFLLIIFFISRYKRCPSDKILVIYGKTGTENSARCIHGGAAFVWPVFQDYEFLDLSPINIEVDLQNALSKQNIRVHVPSRFTVAVSTEQGEMVKAAERLLGKTEDQIRDIAQDIIFGQLRLVIATMDIEEINSDRDKFLAEVMDKVENELKKIGLHLINVNITDIQDESGYIEALGQEAAAQAIQHAKIKVAEEEKKGEIGAARANQEKRVEVASANSAAEIGEADASASAVEGKNLADIKMAESNSNRRQQQAEANKAAEIAEKTAQAEALKEAYIAQQLAEESRKERELAQKRADEVVSEQIAKEKTILRAEAEAERKRKEAEGEAQAILAKYNAEAEGLRAVLKAQAEGFQEIVQAAGDGQTAIGLLMVDKLSELAQIQVDAIKGLNIDKVTVFDGGSGTGTANFVNGLYKSVPALNEFLAQSGLSLPEFLAKPQELLEAPKEPKELNGKAEEPKKSN